MSDSLPGHDAWLDGLYQREIDARVEEEDPDEGADSPCAREDWEDD